MSSLARAAALAAIVGCVVWHPSPVVAQAPAPIGADQGEVLTRGPIHEAFAVPVGFDPAVSAVIPREPPADVEELPPEVSPDDPNAIWIGGYWVWDDERNDFIWISGVWRVPPPDHRWVSGYWTQVEGGFQRIAGFWSPLDTRVVNYVPMPPESLEAGPNVPAPGDNYFWVPGQWVWVDGRYAWRGGYWAPSQTNWVWIPATYYYTPRGCIYSAGYWDYPSWSSRGMMFAPVYFQPAVYAQPNFRYAPRVLIAATQVLVHLFARPNYGSYYFGDYYGNQYAGAGYYPWFAAANVNRGAGWYDPFYVYQRTHYGRTNPNWLDDYRRSYAYFTSNQGARPRHTYAEQRRYAEQYNLRDIDFSRVDLQGANPIQTTILGVALSDAVSNQSLAKQIRKIDERQRESWQKRSQEIKQFAKQQRLDVEARGVGNVALDGAGRRSSEGRPGSNSRPEAGRRASVEPQAAPALQLPEVTPEVAAAAKPAGGEAPPPTDAAPMPNEERPQAGTGRAPGRGPNTNIGDGRGPDPSRVGGRPPRPGDPERPNRTLPPPDATTTPVPGTGETGTSRPVEMPRVTDPPGIRPPEATSPNVPRGAPVPSDRSQRGNRSGSREPGDPRQDLPRNPAGMVPPGQVPGAAVPPGPGSGSRARVNAPGGSIPNAVNPAELPPGLRKQMERPGANPSATDRSPPAGVRPPSLNVPPQSNPSTGGLPPGQQRKREGRPPQAGPKSEPDRGPPPRAAAPSDSPPSPSGAQPDEKKEKEKEEKEKKKK